MTSVEVGLANEISVAFVPDAGWFLVIVTQHSASIRSNNHPKPSSIWDRYPKCPTPIAPVHFSPCSRPSRGRPPAWPQGRRASHRPSLSADRETGREIRSDKIKTAASDTSIHLGARRKRKARSRILVFVLAHLAPICLISNAANRSQPYMTRMSSGRRKTRQGPHCSKSAA